MSCSTEIALCPINDESDQIRYADYDNRSEEFQKLKKDVVRLYFTITIVYNSNTLFASQS